LRPEIGRFFPSSGAFTDDHFLGSLSSIDPRRRVTGRGTSVETERPHALPGHSEPPPESSRFPASRAVLGSGWVHPCRVKRRHSERFSSAGHGRRVFRDAPATDIAKSLRFIRNKFGRRPIRNWAFGSSSMVRFMFSL